MHHHLENISASHTQTHTHDGTLSVMNWPPQSLDPSITVVWNYLLSDPDLILYFYLLILSHLSPHILKHTRKYNHALWGLIPQELHTACKLALWMTNFLVQSIIISKDKLKCD